MRAVHEMELGAMFWATTTPAEPDHGRRALNDPPGSLHKRGVSARESGAKDQRMWPYWPPDEYSNRAPTPAGRTAKSSGGTVSTGACPDRSPASRSNL